MHHNDPPRIVVGTLPPNMFTETHMEQPLNVIQYQTQADQNNDLGRKILALYQEIDHLKEEVNHWRRKHQELQRLLTLYR